jgi:hypothetical protein
VDFKPIALLLLSGCLASAQTIDTKRTLIPGAPTKIFVSPGVATTVLLPSEPSGVFGLGLVGSGATTPGNVQLDHPAGSNVLALHALANKAHAVATVLMDGKLYVLEIETSDSPDVAVTLVLKDSSEDPKQNSKQPDAPKGKLLTAEEVAAERLKFDPEIMVSLLRQARDNEILSPIQPSLYKNYSKRDVFFTSENVGKYKTVVTRVHRFSKEDAIVLQGTVENESDTPLTFDGRAATVLVANEIYPAKLVDCLRPIPAHAKTLIDVLLQGGIDGSRENLSVDNEFRVILGTTPVWQFKNGNPPAGGFKIPIPEKIPMAQVNKVRRDNQ